MKAFMDENFLLGTETAKKLFFEVAKDLPIYDYHCHLDPKEIYEDKRYDNMTEVWLGGDHYKWRLMRAFGVEEAYITGNAPAYEKFLAYAKCIQSAAGNPLYHWSHLELQRYFGIREFLTEETAPAIWEEANRVIRSDEFSARKLIERSNVELVGTTDDPASDLTYHFLLRDDAAFRVKVVPTFRPDRVLAINKPDFTDEIARLGKAGEAEIKTFDDLLRVLSGQIEFFHGAGCRIADHSLTAPAYASPEQAFSSASEIFARAMAGEAVSGAETEQYTAALMLWLGREYAKRGWVMQLHLSALRNNNTRMFQQIGPDTGFDSIHDVRMAENLSRYLDALEQTGGLPKTILYSLNPNDNWVLAAMAGNFQSGGVKGKIQLGSAWWFNDHIDGMEAQMRTLANVGALAAFVGMLTDSRSFLSYPRHEYFRRILCNLIGKWVENGEFTADRRILDALIADICYRNAKNYFGI